MMKRILSKWWFWFLAGIFFFPTLGIIIGIFTGPSPRGAIPFNSYLEETKTEFFFPADCSYTLKSKIEDPSRITEFAKKMKMTEFKVSDTFYEKKSEDGQFIKTISYQDGFIIYKTIQM